MPDLHWLPAPPPDWRDRLRALPQTSPDASWTTAIALAAFNLPFLLTNALDQAAHRTLPEPPPSLATKPVRLAILSSSTNTHLLPAIRVAGLRRGLWIDTYEPDFAQYLQELSDPASALHQFRPNCILVALDTQHLAAAPLAETLAHIQNTWTLAKNAFHCPVIHQTALPLYPPLLGSNEHRLPGSKSAFIAALNHRLRPIADDAGIDLLALDTRAAQDGIAAWHNPTLWHHAKQEITPAIAPLYGDLVARLIAAKQGRSAKCLVLDLDNTLWGGVIGDDGLEGIVIGQGSASGEAFVAFQEYARELSRRGVILAVCSKNDEPNALEPFEKHPEMLLKRIDIASFVANWSDKAANIRQIAAELNIGLDSLVFIDDNPFERNLVRQELPMVAVPEVGEDPSGFITAIADAGYFEALAVTEEDRERTAQYQENKAREALKASTTDLNSYLRGLEMQLLWRPFDRIGLPQIVQLINKSNQFNLTTRRYTEEEILAVMDDPAAFGLQLRLLDRFGDNGIIAIIIGRLRNTADLEIDTWLMSCRVLGRQVEPTTLKLIAEQAKNLGARRLLGEYIPTKKNGMVKDHYPRLGFTVMETTDQGGSRALLDLAAFTPTPTFIHVTQG